MAWIFAVITIALSSGVIFGAVIASKKLSGSGSSATLTELTAKAQTLGDELKAHLLQSGPFASKAQLASVNEQTTDVVEGLEKQKALLKEIESKLESAQKDVESKEAVQQEMKSAKEEDETKLMEVTSKFGTISSDCVALEQELSSSLKSLDTMLAEVPMTSDQRAVFQELSSAMTAGGSRLRDLLTDCQAVNERLENLRLQHQDLEEEYTKLVEQQLGA
jgi:chromosome segregation ATPase